ncbi:MAG: dihydroneopterin aldolase [Sulfurimonas sp.]|jgi:dihydroneopterin aldolase|nr:dihydroneopterin aldolase [Sulfurimonas sp.]
MTIHIEDLRFQAILGILDFERVKAQDVIVDLLIDYTFSSEFIDYAEVAQIVKSEMQDQKFLLIEDALLFFQNHLKQKFPQINTLHLKITKPSIMPDCKVSVSIQKDFNS